MVEPALNTMVRVNNNDLAAEVKRQTIVLKNTKAELSTRMDRLDANLEVRFKEI